jgi:hypothetical protein
LSISRSLVRRSIDAATGPAVALMRWVRTDIERKYVRATARKMRPKDQRARAHPLVERVT